MSDKKDCDEKNTSISYYFLGDKDDLKSETIFKYFDTNNIPLKNILISYFPTITPVTTDKDLTVLLDNLNNNKNIYNTYNIYPIFITVIILIIILIIILLRLMSINYYEIYSYILVFILLILIIIGSIWFLYINNESL
jgi:amino acid transporter